MSSASYFSSLIPELVSDIAAYFDSEQLFSLRLCNGHLCACTRRIFIRRYFHKRTHLLTQRSLECLLDISRDPVLGPAVQELVVSRRTIRGSDDDEAVQRYRAEMEFLNASGLVTTYLTQVLQNAPGCRTVVLDDRCKNPWGESAFKSKAYKRGGLFPFPIQPRNRMESFLCRDLVRSIIFAVANSNIAIRTLDLASHKISAIEQPSALQPHECYERSLARSQWTKTLTTLRLKVVIGDELVPGTPAAVVADFINRFPNLEELYLDLFKVRVEPDAAARSFHKLIRRLQRKARLHTLTLVNVRFRLEDLTALFRAHRNTLRTIELRYVYCRPEPSSSLSASFRKMVKDELQQIKRFTALCSDLGISVNRYYPYPDDTDMCVDYLRPVE